MFKEYIHLYKTNAEFEAAYNGSDYDEPWLSVTDGDASGRVKYNKTEWERLLGTQLTFKITSGGNIKWKANNASSTKEIQYSINGGEWTSVTSTTAGVPISVAANDVVKFKSSVFPAGNSFTYTTAGFELDGNIMSLGGGSGFASLTEITQTSAFTGLFQLCTGLTDASKLLLPATTLANCCYSSMFSGCTSLTTTPELPATTLADNCYYQMFYGCSSLTTAPSLPATTLNRSCYSFMFYRCTSLTTAPELPATTLAQACYYDMFNECTNLTMAPELPATTLANYCYYGMFNGCKSLASAPELPATTLASHCYEFMFDDCTNLTMAPELPATTLASSCYGYMFYKCSKLNYIKAMFTTAPNENYTYQWVYNVASTGTFVKNSAAVWDVTGADGIPTGWTVETA